MAKANRLMFERILEEKIGGNQIEKFWRRKEQKRRRIIKLPGTGHSSCFPCFQMCLQTSAGGDSGRGEE